MTWRYVTAAEAELLADAVPPLEARQVSDIAWSVCDARGVWVVQGAAVLRTKAEAQALAEGHPQGGEP
jgi:hypothetical protein